MFTEVAMSATVQTMSLPCTNPLALAAAAVSAAAENNESNAPSSASSAAAVAKLAAATAAAATTTYTTPKRLAGLAAVTPMEGGTPGGDNDLLEGEGDEPAQKDEAEEANIVSASSTDETAASPAKADTPIAVAAASISAPPAVNAAVAAIAAAKKITNAATPFISLGPRVTPAVRKIPPQTVIKAAAAAESGGGSSSTNSDSPVKPRNLDGALKNKGGYSSTLLSASASAAGNAAAAVSAHQPSQKQDECPTTPAPQQNHIPPPSSFLAAKISPLRSSTRRNGEEKGAAAAGAMMTRENTPPTPPSSSNLDPSKLSPGMFLSPRTPKPITHEGGRMGTKTSGMTPGLTPGLTPTNFASDFGKGHKKEGSMNAMDASNVFAWLHSPGGQGLFSPSGGLNSLSVTNTPRGMYGFTGPAGSASCKGQAAASGHNGFAMPKLAPSSSGHDPSHFFAELEHGGDVGVNTPKIPECQRSMISISPLASKKSKKQAPDTPMSINFSEVFASPRYPTPRLSRMTEASAGVMAAMKEDGMSSSDVQASPVVSALHTAERDINLDDDLNALLQLAETATPGGRHMTFMSPLLTSSLRRASDGKNDELPPSSLQLPMISGSSVSEKSSSQKMRRNGVNSGAISPPHLSIRSTSAGSSPTKTSLKKKSKKRKSPTNMGSPDQHYQQQQQGYHPSMVHYQHPHATHPAPAHSGYYHHPPGYHASTHHMHQMSYPAPHPAPQQHYAYGTERQQTLAATAASTAAPTSASPIKEPSPPKSSSRKSKSSSSRRSKSKSKAASNPPSKASSVSKPESIVVSPGKRSRKASAKSSANSASKKSKTAISDPADKERITAAIYAVNTVYGDGTEKEKKLAAATLRGVTMRPSGKWQAQLYYAGKSRYIGVFDSKEKASLAYEIAREVLKTDKGEEGPANAEETDRNVTLARKAAFAGVNEHCAK